jgi:hypothetical protein
MSDFRKLLAGLSASVVLMLPGCSLWPTWHWEKPGAGDQDYSFDLNQCKAMTYSDASGVVTKESVRRMFACMERKGWSRVEN